MVQFELPSGEIIPVPIDVQSQGAAAMQAFLDNQLARIAAESTEGSN